MLGLQQHNIRQNLREIVMHIKFHTSVLLTITTFLLSLVLSLKTGRFSLIFSVCQTIHITGTS